MVFSKIRNFIFKNLKSFLKKKIIIFESLKVIVGYHYYNKLSHNDDLHIIVIRGASGDVYLQLLLLNRYLRQENINNYTIIGDAPSLRQLAKLFNISDIKILPASICNCIEKFYIFSKDKGENIIIPVCWSSTFQFNKCRIKYSSNFKFIETYFCFSNNIVYDSILKKPTFINYKNIEKIEYFARQKGIIKNKTILISPEANSVTGLPVWFWNSLINDLIAKGYYVFMNCNGFTYYRAPNLFLSYYESVPLLDYAGGFIGVRSGFCDIISTSKCKKVILYPKIKGKIDFSHHRSDVEYSGLKVMGLSNGDNLYEIPTLLLKNITDTEYKIDDFNEYFQELIELRKKILEVFD